MNTATQQIAKEETQTISDMTFEQFKAELDRYDIDPNDVTEFDFQTCKGNHQEVDNFIDYCSDQFVQHRERYWE